MKLITTACAIGALLIPISAFGATWPVYLVANCASTGLTSIQADFCEGHSESCASSSTADSVAPNNTYSVCGLVKMGSTTYIGCFSDPAQCRKVHSCGDGYLYTSQHAFTAANLSGCRVGGICQINNTAQFDCCQQDSQYSAWTESTSNGYAYRYVQYCNASGSWVSVTNNVSFLRRGCLPGYYGAHVVGQSKPTCTRCPSSGGVYGTTATGSTSITQCYIPAGIDVTDSTGTYLFEENCYYKN